MCGDDGFEHVWSTGEDTCRCGSETLSPDDFEEYIEGQDREPPLQLAQPVPFEALDPHFQTFPGHIVERKNGREVGVAVRDSSYYRKHLQRMSELSLKETTQEIRRALDAYDGVRAANRSGGLTEEQEDTLWFLIRLRWDVRFQPGYLIRLKTRASVERNSGVRALLARLERRLQPFPKGRPGRPRRHAGDQLDSIRPQVLSDAAVIEPRIQNLWKAHRGSGLPSDLVSLARELVPSSIPDATVRAEMRRLWRRKSLKPKAIAAALLRLKWGHHPQGVKGLREAQVAKMITPAWSHAPRIQRP